MNLKERFGVWLDVLRIQVDFLRELGFYRLNSAKSELVAAVASNQLALARMKATVALELEGALRRLHRVEGRSATQISRISRLAKDAAYMINGADMTKSRMDLMWAAFRVFERMVPLEQLEAVMKLELTPAARRGDQFIDKYEPARECIDVPVEVDNAYMFVGWIKRKHYLPFRGSKAHLHVIQVFQTIADVAQKQLDSINHAREQIRANTFDIWNPLVIASMPDSIDVRKILTAGIKSL
ncbi:MAG: hypothetical protein VX738_13755 [Planctomycetota bacterium]|nr:hypothetical protein [Planctomycetota bacterium]